MIIEKLVVFGPAFFEKDGCGMNPMMRRFMGGG